jgi:hypothetical protein
MYIGVYSSEYEPVVTEAAELHLDFSSVRAPKPFNPESAGVRLAVHNRRQLPDMDSSVVLRAGSETHLPFSKQVLKAQPPPWGNCAPKFWDEAKNVPADSGNYSVAACELVCAAKETEQRCGCELVPRPRGYIPSRPNLRPCPFNESSADGVCALLVEDEVLTGSLNCPECVDPCQSTLFSVRSSDLAWPAPPSAPFVAEYFEQLASDGNIGGAHLRNLSQTAEGIARLRENVLLVRVYPEREEYEVVTTNRAYSITSLLSDLGGQMGLWAGISVLTIAEVFELLMLVVTSVLGCKCSASALKDEEDESVGPSVSIKYEGSNPARDALASGDSRYT